MSDEDMTASIVENIVGGTEKSVLVVKIGDKKPEYYANKTAENFTQNGDKYAEILILARGTSNMGKALTATRILCRKLKDLVVKKIGLWDEEFVDDGKKFIKTCVSLHIVRNGGEVDGDG